MEKGKGGREGAPLPSRSTFSSSSCPRPSSPPLLFPATSGPHQAHVSLVRHILPLCLLLLFATSRGGHVLG